MKAGTRSQQNHQSKPHFRDSETGSSFETGKGMVGHHWRAEGQIEGQLR